MPNTPAIVQEGMSVMALCGCFYGTEVAIVRSILMSIGKVLTLPEELMNTVTALSGSGPAFIALFTEAMIEGGERLGLGRADSSQLAVQTLLGTAKLLDTGMSPEKLRQMVTSPGGTTEAGLKVFEERDLKGVVDEALRAAEKMAEELGRRA
jgi:pyrroline-5-carboxylate reductase